MHFQRLTVWTLAAALTAASLAVPGTAADNAADVNGDAIVDVLDVQRVLAAVTQRGPVEACFDVNGDGAVDILDYQFILAQATYARSSEQDIPEGPAPDGVIPQRVLAPVLQLASAFPTPQSDRQPACGGQGLRLDAYRSAQIPPKTERYLYTLTPHAPPQRG